MYEKYIYANYGVVYKNNIVRTLVQSSIYLKNITTHKIIKYFQRKQSRKIYTQLYKNIIFRNSSIFSNLFIVLDNF